MHCKNNMHKSDWLGNNPAVRDKKLSTFCYKSNKKNIQF